MGSTTGCNQLQTSWFSRPFSKVKEPFQLFQTGHKSLFSSLLLFEDHHQEGIATGEAREEDFTSELDNQVPLVDEIDTKVDKATSDIKNINVRLKQTLNQVRSSHNFCIDIILLCIILGIVSYLYK
ncbi:hypothetical protein F8388_023313 [Cannabis sativa]|uniref:t-SNARE coiled-coil homology domain-containing protein n=1 Tax=Cannabis sativa TaxID=3483 RepID=A0A7J6DSC8_CANSA|nr:hypothetical protein G4B88_002681 [Cannabis sativa]KAF4349012.1 hypothetical protein G4B88_012752 [Cannabis sativa]KAF4393509.1 hypothetical protein F8388_023313 [Cannabis sativa]